MCVGVNSVQIEETGPPKRCVSCSARLSRCRPESAYPPLHNTNGDHGGDDGRVFLGSQKGEASGSAKQGGGKEAVTWQLGGDGIPFGPQQDDGGPPPSSRQGVSLTAPESWDSQGKTLNI